MSHGSVAVEPGSSAHVLVAEDLSKSYGSRRALLGLSFSLRAGRILGFLGPNGAGKTTSIRILTTILEPSSGYFVVDGIHSRHPERIRQRIGALPESLGFHRQMTGLECLTFFGRLYGRPAAAATAHGMELLREVGLENRAKSSVGSYSRGMRQRLGIARALVNDPVVVFLDEPTLGLDPRGQQELLALVRCLARERGVGIVLCSHALAEIESVCDDVVILNAGQVVATGTVAEVLGNVQGQSAKRNAVRIQIVGSQIETARQVLEALPSTGDIAPVNGNAGWLRVELLDPTKALPSRHLNNEILNALIRAEIPILAFEAEGGRLHDVFLQLTEETIQ
ncbi:ABC transporter ATP-binding protein [Mesorhizobium silamurunense]|uniref:ABC transporter ATP-binding protein n=1 Tax=Mesorhizobium silamurunense TaxID=499528 RepID=UPI001786B8A8|nr:ABC transporter ATP-binding protein [Mesorhizobium silamurunense]